MTRARHQDLKIAILVTAALLVFGAAAALAVIRGHSHDTSAIKGRVLAGCVPRGTCLGVPIEASQIVSRKTDGRTERVATFRSAQDGSFLVKLPPGEYVITSSPGQGLGRLPPARVRVQGSETSRVVLTYGTTKFEELIQPPARKRN
jgi:hypothetical protein